MSNPWIAVGALAVVGVSIPVLMMTVSALLRPSVPETSKRASYESGEVPTGGVRIRFNIQYYMVALLFVVFDMRLWFLVYTIGVLPAAIAYGYGQRREIKRLTGLADQLDTLATRDRDPDHGRLARIENALTDLEASSDVAEQVASAHESVVAFRETVDGV